MQPEIISIIPARGGSKGIPKKNIVLLAGKPLIAYSIGQSLQCQYIKRTIVSTDDPEIADIAREYGAEVPFVRPKELATDDTPDLPVFEHALDWLEKHERYIPDIIIHLRPTSPLREVRHIEEALGKLISDSQADSIRGVCPPGQNPFKMWKIESKYMEPLLSFKGVKEPYNAPRQCLPQVYWQNGHIDITRYATIRNKHSMTGDNILPYVMEPEYTIDIDSPASIKMAESILEISK
jgi:CMP-N-acetylneuraminic acid synthetase